MRSPRQVEHAEAATEIDLRGIGTALMRRRRTILLPTLAAFLIMAVFVNVVTPRYTAESQVLLENQENFFTRPDRVNQPPEQNTQIDQEGVASQVQLISSRDIARRAIKKLGLAGNAEFDPLADGLNPFTRLGILLGLVPDPTRESADSRMVTKFLEKLTVFSPTKTRVISIQFTSRSPELASRAANTVAQLYLQEQSAAKRAAAKVAAEALASQIADLRTKLASADAEREQYRLQSGLLAGSNNMTLSGQQLADINSDLSKARAAQADAQAKAELIRQLIREGKAANVADVINNDIVRRVSDQRFLAQAQLARESRTLLAGHPRIKELAAQLSEYDLALKSAAKQAVNALENEAKIAGQRVANLETVLGEQKKVAGVANGDEVHLRALERIAQSYKDQLESSTAKYQEALARQSSIAAPADARIISSASRPQEPSFPKKMPLVIFGTIATLMFAAAFVAVTEMLGASATAADAARLHAEDAPVHEMASHETHARETDIDAKPADRAAPAMKTRRAWDYFGEASTAEAAADPVFPPVGPKSNGHESNAAKAQMHPSADKLRALVEGGLLGTALTFIKGFGRSAEASRAASTPTKAEMPGSRSNFGWDQDESVWHKDNPGKDESGKDEPDVPSHDMSPVARKSTESTDIGPLVERIVAAHVPGRGLHIVGTCLDSKARPDILIDLGRMLSPKGRAIIVDLNRTPSGLASLADAHNGQAKIVTMHGLAELLSGDATFAEVIHRDPTSRLHFIPTGLQEADFRDFDLILDALSETYDFILLLAPDYPKSEIAKIMAPYADFVVLASARMSADRSIAALEEELLDAGAREVLVAGPAQRRSLEVA